MLLQLSIDKGATDNNQRKLKIDFRAMETIKTSLILGIKIVDVKINNGNLIYSKTKK